MLSLHNGLVYFHSICVWWMEPRFTQELEAKDIERLAGNEVNVYLDPVGSTVRYEVMNLCTGSV